MPPMLMDRSRIVSLSFAVLYGLAVLALGLVCLFLLAGLYRSLFMVVMHFSELSKQELMLTSFALIELVLVCFLILLFVHALLLRAYAQAALRAAFLIVLMSTIAVLQKFLDIGNQPPEQLFWSIALHFVLVATSVIVYLIDRHSKCDPLRMISSRQQ